MANFKTTIKILVVLAMVAGLGLAVIGSDAPTSIKPYGLLDDTPNIALKEELAPQHYEPGEEVYEDEPAVEVYDPMNPPAEEIAAKLEELRASTIVSSPLIDAKYNPNQSAAPITYDPGLRVDLYYEGFEGGVPPATWTSIVNNPFTWDTAQYNPYEGVLNAHCVYDETYSGPQNEWLISDPIDLTGGTAWKLDFWWLGSYYWSVDPYPNCTLTVFISTDGGTNWDYLWNQYEYGVFDNWTWYNTIIDLGAYLTASSAQFAFVYTGYDGAEFGLDLVTINDAAPPVGRCCYGVDFLTCADLTEAECTDSGGYWNQFLDCTTPCPVVPDNDFPETAEEIFPPATITGSTAAATLDCPGVLDWNAVWYVFDAPYAENDIDISYCGTPGEIQTVGIVLYEEVLPLDCNAFIVATNYEFITCAGDGLTNPIMDWDRLPAGRYLFPVHADDVAKGGMDFSFDITVVESPPLPPGASCNDPLQVTLGAGDLPYLYSGTTCGFGDLYENSCLGSYDGGEDFIMELTLTEELELDFVMDPGGDTYTGFMIADACGDVDPCIVVQTNSGGGIYQATRVTLAAGTYYIMFDTWPLPDCIAAFNFAIDASPPPQPGDNCDDPLKIDLPAELPYFGDNLYTCGRGDSYNNTCLGTYDDDEDIIIELTLASDLTLNFKMDPKGTSGTNGMMIMANCPPLDEFDCIVTNTIYGGINMINQQFLAAGTYYIMIDHYPGTCLPDFSLEIEEYGGPTPGDDCANPISVKLPDDMTGGDGTQYVDVNTTCLRIDDYENTCLGSYDGGEDIIYMLDVGVEMTFNFLMHTSTTWTGMMIADACGDVDPCLFSVTGSASNAELFGVTLPVGIYYLMIDTYPSPDCIPEFTLTIEEAVVVENNDSWAYCDAIGDVTDLAYTTTDATPDGPLGCQTAPNKWFCYTATCDGQLTVSLCGSSYDTKLAVYSGFDPLTGVEVGCNDDACGLQSEIAGIPCSIGDEFIIEVGGYSSNTGDGLLTVFCSACDAPDNDNCESVTPVVLAANTPVTFTGDNTCATEQCASFPGGHVWEAFTLTSQADVTLDYCGTSPAFGNAWLNLAYGCPCDSFTVGGVFNTTDCGDGNVTIVWEGLPAGTYYYPVMLDPDNGAEGAYTINVVAGVPSTLTWDPAIVDFGLQGAGTTGSTNLTLEAVGGTPIAFTVSYLYDVKKSRGFAPYVDLGVDKVTKAPYTGPDYVNPAEKQGGDDIASAIVIGSLPHVSTGTTSGYTNDYDEVCNFTGSTSPDVVYEYTPGADITVDVHLCNSSYDTKLYLYENSYTPGAPFACNDDECPGYMSALYQLALTGGNTYYIVVDGYGTAEGDYQLDMVEYVEPDPFQCPAGAIAEAEACGSDANGGCNSAPPAYEAINCNDTICGTSWADASSRDTDWYTFTLYTTTTITLTGSSNFNNFILGFVDTSDCALAAAIDPYATGNANDVVTVSREAGPGTYWIFAGMTVYEGFPCGTQNDYWFTLTCPEGPVLWLSATPEAGTVPAGGTFDLTVNYDATELDEGVYNADLVLTHDGIKATTVTEIPVMLEIGEAVIPDTMLVTPNPLNIAVGFAVDPIAGEVFMGDAAMSGGNTVNDMDMGTVLLNGTMAPTSHYVTTVPNFDGEVMVMEYDATAMVAYYSPGGPVWDCTTVPFTVTGDYTGGGSFSHSHDIEFCGHVSGDLNMDGSANIADLVDMVAYMFAGGPVPLVPETADVNGDGSTDIADVVRFSLWMFAGGEPLTHP